MVIVKLYPCIVRVALLMYLFVLCGACLAVCLNCLEVFSVGGGAPLDRPCMVLKECARCACDPSVDLSVPSIGYVYVFVCRKLSPHLRV